MDLVVSFRHDSFAGVLFQDNNPDLWLVKIRSICMLKLKLKDKIRPSANGSHWKILNKFGKIRKGIATDVVFVPTALVIAYRTGYNIAWKLDLWSTEQLRVFFIIAKSLNKQSLNVGYTSQNDWWCQTVAYFFLTKPKRFCAGPDIDHGLWERVRGACLKPAVQGSNRLTSSNSVFCFNKFNEQQKETQIDPWQKHMSAYES